MNKKEQKKEEKERLIKCGDCMEWARDGHCNPFERIIKAPDKEHYCRYYQKSN